MANVQQRVDHRSLKDRYNEAILKGDQELAFKLDRPPEPKLGVGVCAIEEKAKKRFERSGQKYIPVTRLFRDLMVIRNCRHAVSKGLGVVEQVEEEIKRVRRRLQILNENEQTSLQENSIPSYDDQLKTANSSASTFEDESAEFGMVSHLSGPSPF